METDRPASMRRRSRRIRRLKMNGELPNGRFPFIMIRMHAPSDKKVELDLTILRQNVQAIRRRTGVEVWAVIKADAYGLNAVAVARAIADAVDGFCFFRLVEAVEADIWNLTHKPSITLGPPDGHDAEAFLKYHVRPAVANVEQARRLRAADPILAVDTGMHRFSCPPDEVPAALEAGTLREVFTHATRLEHVERLLEITRGYDLKRHAAASALLDEPGARLNAVRPGIAMYDRAVRVTAPLREVHAAAGPIGYTGFTAPRHGVIVVGYSNGLRPGQCLINGQPRRVLEVGMQSAYVEIGPDDRLGDEVVLLGDGLTPQALSPLWGCSPQEVLYRLARM